MISRIISLFLFFNLVSCVDFEEGVLYKINNKWISNIHEFEHKIVNFPSYNHVHYFHLPINLEGSSEVEVIKYLFSKKFYSRLDDFNYEIINNLDYYNNDNAKVINLYNSWGMYNLQGFHYDNIIDIKNPLNKKGIYFYICRDREVIIFSDYIICNINSYCHKLIQYK